VITTPEPWTNEKLLHYFLSEVVKYIFEVASVSCEPTIDAAAGDNLDRLRNQLVELQVGVAVHILSLIDATNPPSAWPGLKLVNAETGESLSDYLTWAFSRVERKYLATRAPEDRAE
jgi:hypothetical protein